MSGIKKYKVPSLQLPSSFKDKKRERGIIIIHQLYYYWIITTYILGDMGWDVTNKRKKETHQYNDYKQQKEEKILIMEERHKIMKSIKELAATTLTGINRKEYKEDKLTKLGAPPVAKQKIPLKMKIGLEKGKEKIIKKSMEIAQASGVVLPKGYLDSLKTKKKEKVDKLASDAPNFDAPVKNGIFHLNKNKIDKRLLSAQKSRK